MNTGDGKQKKMQRDDRAGSGRIGAILLFVTIAIAVALYFYYFMFRSSLGLGG